ncbi:hypothetical protein [Sneathiella limimaris]|uniref:hypothetical protein n=1 Tax=Sneathiella limimaris TaxID=1964213 RepID=UPI00146EE0AA|nr:hypothetical protein [Sneathiella limimaris]
MTNMSIEELKIRAKKLQKSALAGDPAALKRLRRVWKGEGELKRKLCLNAIGMELGFRDWAHARDVLEGTATGEANRGTFWYSNRCMPFLNHWFADYQEAKVFLLRNQGYTLVPYKTQFVVVEDDFLEAINLNEECDALWQEIHHDAVHGYGTPAWQALVYRRISHLRDAP